MNNKGQSILSEYVMIFFVVIAALVAMTTFVQRSLEARVHDARNYMIDSVINSNVCDANCVAATGGAIGHEYEPYYALMNSSVQQNEAEGLGETPGNAKAIGAIYYKTGNESAQTNSTSVQLAPGSAN